MIIFFPSSSLLLLIILCLVLLLITTFRSHWKTFGNIPWRRRYSAARIAETPPTSVARIAGTPTTSIASVARIAGLQTKSAIRTPELAPRSIPTIAERISVAPSSFSNFLISHFSIFYCLYGEKGGAGSGIWEWLNSWTATLFNFFQWRVLQEIATVFRFVPVSKKEQTNFIYFYFLDERGMREMDIIKDERAFGMINCIVGGINCLLAWFGTLCDIGGSLGVLSNIFMEKWKGGK